MAMTFEQWQAGRRYVPDLSAEVDDACVEGPGYVYPGKFYINDENRPDLGGKWRLLLERDEWYSDDLDKLERQLFAWVDSEGAL